MKNQVECLTQNSKPRMEVVVELDPNKGSQAPCYFHFTRVRILHLKQQAVCVRIFFFFELISICYIPLGDDELLVK